MSKIKDIQARLLKDPREYSGFTFLVAQRAFLLVVTLYFMSLLGTVGGFYTSFLSLKTLSAISFHAYSLTILTAIWFSFAWSEYMVYIYAPNKRWLSFAVLGVTSII